MVQLYSRPSLLRCTHTSPQKSAPLTHAGMFVVVMRAHVVWHRGLYRSSTRAAAAVAGPAVASRADEVTSRPAARVAARRESRVNRTVPPRALRSGETTVG